MSQRIAAARCQGGEVAVVDFGGDPLLSLEAGNLHLLPAQDYFCGTQRWPANPEIPLDGMVVNLLPSWFGFDQVLQYFLRPLRSGGLFAFSAFGPDTLQEVERAWREVDELPHVHPFLDMHHLGDMMLKAGLKDPIVDAQWITIEYPDYPTLARDLRYSGFGNVHAARRKTLTGKNRYLAFLNDLQANSAHASQINVTFEMIYGLGFMPLARVPDSTGRILVDPPA